MSGRTEAQLIWHFMFLFFALTCLAGLAIISTQPNAPGAAWTILAAAIFACGWGALAAASIVKLIITEARK